MKVYTVQELNNFMVSRAAGSTESTEPLAQLSNQEILLIIEDTNTTPIYIYIKELSCENS